MKNDQKKKVYVTMTDKFMSGWGMAEHKIDKLVIECDNFDEAGIVAQNAKYRSEMKNVNIVQRKPSYNQYRYKTDFHDKSDYASWFIPKYFAKESVNQ